MLLAPKHLVLGNWYCVRFACFREQGTALRWKSAKFLRGFLRAAAML